MIVKGVASDPTGETNAVCFRLVADTMQDSVFAQIQWAIDTLGMSHLWKSTTKPLRHTYIPTGAQIIYKGLDKAEKLKSIRPKRGIFRYIWLEEFAELPGAGFVRNVMQSVIRGKGQKFTVFRSFNPPISKNNWANTFIQQPDPKAKTLLTNYTMIPPEWLGEEFIYEAERLRELNPDAYRHEYLGEAVGTGGEVFPTLEIREITKAEIDNMEYIYQGVDFGFAADPACFIRMAYDRKHETLYFIDEIYKRGISNAALAQEIKDRRYNDYEVICDCAEPKSVTDLRDNGLPARSCYKAPGCVEYRVKWLQHRKIVIDPRRTPNAHREFVNYSYPVDKNEYGETADETQKLAREIEDLSGELAQSKKEFREAAKAADSLDKSLDDIDPPDKLGDFFGGIAAGLTVGALELLEEAAQAIFEFGKKSIGLASDLQEVQNVVDTAFPNMSREVEEFAQSAIKSAGLSETAAKKYLGTYGTMAESFGFTEKAAFDLSTTMVQLAGDVASFYNISADEAYTKLMAVFTGETEALKELGVVMTETELNAYAMEKGIDKGTQGMGKQENGHCAVFRGAS